MRVILDLLKIVLLSILLLLMLLIKVTKNIFGWVYSCMEQVMSLGEKGVDGEISKLKILIKDIAKKIYSKISS